MTEPTTAARPVHPMDNDPIGYPLTLPSSLSADAQIMYRYGRHSRLTRDVFDPKTRNSFMTQAQEKAFEPTERMLAAIAELEEAQLASYSSKYGHSLQVTEVHEHYTVAFGRGTQLIRVSTFSEHPDEKQLLAVLVGGDVEGRDSQRSGITEVSVRARHEDATDVEHDASSTAVLTVRMPTPAVFSGYGRVEFQGVLSEARLYGAGVDPLTQNDEDTISGEMCTECETPHPYAPYQPPVAAWLDQPTLVSVELLPLRPYLVADQEPESPSMSTDEPASSSNATGNWQHAEECHGGQGCAAEKHEHGCFSDAGECSDPGEHPVTIQAP